MRRLAVWIAAVGIVGTDHVYAQAFTTAFAYHRDGVLWFPFVLGEPCDGSTADPWVTELRDRLMSSDGLARYAVEQFGDPLRCEGVVTSEFDGQTFGRLVLGFDGGASLEVETMPPEAQVVRLEVPDGIQAEDSAKALMREYADGIGLQIDWSAASVHSTGTTREETFQDPEDGLNASVTFSYRGEMLVGMRLSLAL